VGNPDRGWAIALFIPLACRNWTREHTHTGGLETAAEAGKKPGREVGQGLPFGFQHPAAAMSIVKTLRAVLEGWVSQAPIPCPGHPLISLSPVSNRSHLTKPIVTHNNSPLLVVDAIVRILESRLFAYTYEYTPHLTSPVAPLCPSPIPASAQPLHTTSFAARGASRRACLWGQISLATVTTRTTRKFSVSEL